MILKYHWYCEGINRHMASSLTIHCADLSGMAVYQLPVDGRFTCSGNITKYKLCFTNWTSNVTVTLVRFRAVQILDQTVASTGVAHVQLVITDDILAGNDFVGVLKNGYHNASLPFYCNNYLGYTIPSRSAHVMWQMYLHAWKFYLITFCIIFMCVLCSFYICRS